MERLSQHSQWNKMNLEVRLMKRIYSVVVFGNEENDIMLVLKFTDQKFQSLSNFLNSEVHNFYPHIYKELEAVVFCFVVFCACALLLIFDDLVVLF